MSAGTETCQTCQGHTKINTHAHITFNLHQVYWSDSLKKEEEKNQARVKKRRNWRTYTEPNSCWEWGAYLPTTANMSFSIRWKALSLSLIFCSISPGNLFRVGEKREQNSSKAYWLDAWRVIACSSQSGGADSVNSGPQQQHDYLLYAREKSIWGSSLLVQQTTHTKNITLNCLYTWI